MPEDPIRRDTHISKTETCPEQGEVLESKDTTAEHDSSHQERLQEFIKASVSLIRRFQSLHEDIEKERQMRDGEQERKTSDEAHSSDQWFAVARDTHLSFQQEKKAFLIEGEAAQRQVEETEVLLRQEGNIAKLEADSLCYSTGC